MKRTALITGATSGIGRATAHEFAKHGINLVLCGRRQQRLDSIKNTLSKETHVHTLNFDVRDKDKTREAIT
jgi:NADP-dependent 3-hydroxy acid dehydrogenase YdfG